MKVSKELTLFPLGPYKSCKISVTECDDWKEANATLYKEYIRMRKHLSEADQQRLDELLK